MAIHIPMDSVHTSFTTEEWIAAEKARVTIQIFCSYTESPGQSEVRRQMQEALRKVAEIDWRFLGLKRFRDNAGMERWESTAEQRINEANLSQVRKQAKAVSTPGMKLEVSDVDYTPTAAEYETLYAAMRKDLYGKIQAEIDLLNKSFDGRKFRVGNVAFGIDGDAQAAQAVAYGTANPLGGRGGQRVMRAATSFEAAGSYRGGDDADDAADDDGGFAVSKKVVMTASVTLSSVVKGFDALD